MNVAVGATLSMLTAAEVLVAAGPLLPAVSLTAAAASRGATVPSRQPVAVAVKIEFAWMVAIVNVQPAAVPALVMSAEVSPEMFSLKFKVKTGEPVVGLCGAGPHEKVGALLSIATEIVAGAVAGPVSPLNVFTEFAASAIETFWLSAQPVRVAV